MLLDRRHFLSTILQAAALSQIRARSAIDFRQLLPKRIPRSGIFKLRDFMVWGASVVRTEDCIYHMYFSRWPLALGHRSWVSHSEIAYATSMEPEGPFTFQSVALPARGGGFWDGHMTHNPCVIAHEGKFYLYYTGNHGARSWKPDVAVSEADWWVHRNNQRIGVAVADRPTGPWVRSDRPLLDTPDYGQGIIGVPCVTLRSDGSFLLVYKTLASGTGEYGGGVFHYPAIASSPLGPFVRYPRPMVDKSIIFHQHFNFHIDDHVEWFQDGRYYAIVKDHDAPYLTKYGKCLYLMESIDGLEWKISSHSLVTRFALDWDNGTHQQFERLEMPKLLLESGRSRVLFLAALPSDDPSEHSFNVAIPLRH